MAVIIGSARSDERGKLSGGKAGDQTGKEVSTQAFYMHSKGWIGLRAKDINLANKLAKAMKIACDNNHIGYDQSQRLGAYNNGITTTIDTETDCSALVRACLSYCGVSVGNFTTANAVTVLMATGLFTKVTVNSVNDVKDGDILCTKSKGHIVIVVSGAPRQTATKTNDNPYPVPTRTLKKGMKGNDVKWVQFVCQKDGIYVSGGCDGDFGQGTKNAVIEFQRKHGLSRDGVVGAKTIATMKTI
jgi:hypothetical protein